MKPAIRVEKLCKRYPIGKSPVVGIHNLTETLTEGLKNLWNRLAGPVVENPADVFWALNDVSFEVKPGEVVGIIGRNGAGKSTLLKILSRIVEPSSGRVDYRGRIASLLEVGTGFHPELTGRENIYMNAILMGMKRKEINRKLNEIIAFSEIERFIDTPVKRYSSGMYVRLAFAVAAYVEPDILVVDEVLAVGDATFQKKCMGKMHEVGNEGRTILFVSHNMGAVTALCNRCLWLDQGNVKADGPTAQAIESYHASVNRDDDTTGELGAKRRSGNGKARITAVRLTPLSRDGAAIATLMPGEGLAIDIEVQCFTDFQDGNLAVIIYTQNGVRLIDVNLAEKGYHLTMHAGDRLNHRFQLKDILLRPDTYTIGLWIGRHNAEEIDHLEYAINFTVEHDPANRHGLVTFPGPYMCPFDTTSPQVLPTGTVAQTRTTSPA